MPRFNILLYYYQNNNRKSKTKVLVPNTILKDVNDLQLLNNPVNNDLTQKFNELCKHLPKIEHDIDSNNPNLGNFSVFGGPTMQIQFNLYAQILGSDFEYLINQPQINAEIQTKSKSQKP